MIKLYLDIDGVLLTAKQTRPAPGVDEFVDFITANFTCYWLTMHCKGDSIPALQYLSKFLKSTTLEKLRQAVQPTNWDTLKTEAIDITADFYWLDDMPLQIEADILEKHGVDCNLIRVDLTQEGELVDITLLLSKHTQAKQSH